MGKELGRARQSSAHPASRTALPSFLSLLASCDTEFENTYRPAVLERVPDRPTETSADAFIRFDELLQASDKAVEGLAIPTELRKQVSAALDEHPELAWNQAVRSIAAGDGSGERAQ